uniref:C3H1-type domain-containing protein n=1 Tax=Pseudo-nitzschia delicatissima TaxID=44447 RepID=A0A7S0TAJ2_9STRA|mmetsp:Transcript_1278/g.2939  ORF Transcript_1278/g.2939 Transcript_1278/m.2939 type:complete len:436 (+) Transcript_1278:119-1426(+)
MSPFFSYSGRRGRGRGGRGTRGRGRAGRGNSLDRRAYHNNHKWVRPTASAQTEHDMKNGEQEESKLKSSNIETGQADTESKQEKEKDESVPISTYSHRIMKKNGQHKLILSSNIDSAPVASGDSLSKNEPQSQLQPATQTLTREGRNKLVSLTNSNSAEQKEQKKKLSTNSRPVRQYESVGGRLNKSRSAVRGPTPTSRRTRAARSTTSRPIAKRIKLSVQESVDCGDQTLSSTSPTTADADSEANPTEKLSDFAYKEVSRVRQRVSGRSLRWSKKGNGEPSNGTYSDNTSIQNPRKTKSMGLVRVQPNEKTTPICPTFLRGLHCQDQFCRKRHDIPKEYAMPVCSFFQRQGQCLKGESCIFRHIKVNAKAMVCPSFALLGFCEDEQCAMQHVRGRTAVTALNANGTRSPKRSSSRFRRKQSNVYHRKKSANGDG